MKQINEGIKQYWSAIQTLQKRVIESQLDLLSEVAAAMVTSTQQGGHIFLFGTGHSHMLAEEGHYRAGGLASVVPILLSSLMLHESAMLSGVIERTPGLAEPLLARYQTQPGDMLFIFSNSGVNQLPVEMAQVGKAQGLTVVSVSALAYAQVAPLSALKQRLDEVADYAIDNGGQAGDSLIKIEGLSWSVGPSSTITGCLIWHCLVTETAMRLQSSGLNAPIIASANMSGAAKHNEKLLQKWGIKNPHL